MVTASRREDPNEPTDIVIHRSRIAAAPDLELVKASFKTYLEQPWKEYARMVVLKSEIDGVIEAEGWHEWNRLFATETLYYEEYRNTHGGHLCGTAWPPYLGGL
ncbi:hypothetical protein Cni_G25075 [Canna indica]|uniref:Pectinesterase catalytic domain-containing protein n=1 Tax=Canna indica TaxID=4628 RepID=A0AAQ3QNW1_9LILI|nr:hypothetical protein Cni_G25075 [Canna indica]